MNDELSERQHERTRLETLIRKVRTASEGQDFDKAARLQDEILQLQDELRPTVNEMSGECQRRRSRLETLIRQVRTASEGQDFDKAARLQDEILQLHDEFASGPGRTLGAAGQDHERTALLVEEVRPPSPEAEIEFEIGRRNFVRAVMLMERCRYPAEQVRHFQERALKQYAFEYRNPQGLQKLIQWYGFSESDVRRVMEEGHSE